MMDPVRKKLDALEVTGGEGGKWKGEVGELEESGLCKKLVHFMTGEDREGETETRRKNAACDSSFRIPSIFSREHAGPVSNADLVLLHRRWAAEAVGCSPTD